MILYKKNKYLKIILLVVSSYMGEEGKADSVNERLEMEYDIITLHSITWTCSPIVRHPMRDITKRSVTLRHITARAGDSQAGSYNRRISLC